MVARQSPEYGHFLRGLIRDPKGVSAPTPSSPALARAIAADVDLSREGLVLELGPGTGAVTQALLDRGLSPERLIAIERESSFVQVMRERFPFVKLYQGDAMRFDTFLPPDAQVAAVVSGLPLLHVPMPTRHALLRRALACQDQGGRFVQLSYSWRPPVEPGPNVAVTRKIVWRNFPPAHVWTFAAIRPAN